MTPSSASLTRGLLRRMGPDGLLMLAASFLVAVATGGATLLWAVATVVRGAITATTDDPMARSIFIFGMRLTDDEPGDDYQQRLERGVAMAAAHPTASLYLLGGYTGGTVNEAEAGRRYLVERGVEPERITVEEESTHSLENLREARDLLVKRHEEGAVTVVSSRYHLVRIETLAGGLGMTVTPVAGEDRMSWRPATVWRLFLEGVFLHWYHTGRIISHAIGSRHMLDRIT